MTYLLVNFGGPRDLDEVGPFLETLLTDPDVIRTPFPRWIQNWLFRRVARKRTPKIRGDYEEIGGRSPIYFDTEALAERLAEKLQAPVLTFHRYLPATHAESLQKIEAVQTPEIRVIPLFPQFSYATTGSIARLLASKTKKKLLWIASYADHPAYIRAQREKIAQFLASQSLLPSDTTLFFSAHGLPRSFVDSGDPYEKECQRSFAQIRSHFPQNPALLAYQSKFGRGEWLRPYTDEMCQSISAQQVVFIPLSFTSDHIETLFEIEKLYLEMLRKRGIAAYRCPALNLEPYWIEALAEIAQTSRLTPSTLLYK